jgi:hypothetical protein
MRTDLTIPIALNQLAQQRAELILLREKVVRAEATAALPIASAAPAPLPSQVGLGTAVPSI